MAVVIRKNPLNFLLQKSISFGGGATLRFDPPPDSLNEIVMVAVKIKSRPLLLGPLILLIGLTWAGAAEKGLLSFPQALPYGLAVAAAGLIVWGLHGLRAGTWRLFSLAILLAGGAFFAVQLNYLRVDYNLAGTEPLRALLPGRQDQLLARIINVSSLLVVSCLLGLLAGKFGSRHGAGPKAPKKSRRPQTAPTRSSRLIRSLKR